MLGERLIKRMKHLSKWGRRQGISCFRLYERDIPDHPIVIDWFADEDAEHIGHAGDAVAWFHQRTRDETPEETAEYQRSACEEICSSLGLAPDRLFVKQRARQRDEQGGRAQYEKLDTRRICKTVCEQGARFDSANRILFHARHVREPFSIFSKEEIYVSMMRLWQIL